MSVDSARFFDEESDEGRKRPKEISYDFLQSVHRPEMMWCHASGLQFCNPLCIKMQRHVHIRA